MFVHSNGHHSKYIHKIKKSLCALCQKNSKSSDHDEIRNIVNGIYGIIKDENIDKFCIELKPVTRSDALEDLPVNLARALIESLHVDVAFYGIGMFNYLRQLM